MHLLQFSCEGISKCFIKKKCKQINNLPVPWMAIVVYIGKASSPIKLFGKK